MFWSAIVSAIPIATAAGSSCGATGTTDDGGFVAASDCFARLRGDFLAAGWVALAALLRLAGFAAAGLLTAIGTAASPAGWVADSPAGFAASTAADSAFLSFDRAAFRWTLVCFTLTWAAIAAPAAVLSPVDTDSDVFAFFVAMLDF
jgi:hypothetical protein